MNEFNAQTGGRYVYVDDVLNLQDLALAFGRIFDECDNFIISGCEVSGSTISSGYVYLNGKIRYFSGVGGVTSWPQYLYEKNSTESVHYASGDTKVGRNIYGVAFGSFVPTTNDPITGKVPVSITMTQNGGTAMKDAFFGKYALILNPANLSQVLNGTLKIDGDLDVTGNIRSQKNRYRIIEDQATFDAFFSDGIMTFQTKYNSDSDYSVTVENGVGLNVYNNNVLAMKVGDDGTTTFQTMQATLGVFGKLGVSSKGICNYTEASDSGTLNINLAGYNGTSKYFRNTVIGNGKQAPIVTVNGKSWLVSVNGALAITSSTTAGITLSAKTTKDSVDLQNTILWQDSNEEAIGVLGFTEVDDFSMRLTNNLAGVYVYGASNSFVDLGPAIKENGQLLSDKYVQVTDLTATIDTLAAKSSVYTKEQSDARYSKVAKGFGDYLSAGFTAQNLRDHIQAAGVADLANYLRKSAYLSDIAVDDASKKTIRTNIGAVGNDECQSKLTDTGWILVTGDNLWARQIGNIVCIQGTATSVHSGTVFTIPNQIDPPTHAVSLVVTKNYQVQFAAGSRTCQVGYCDNAHNKTLIFSLTYMV